MREVTKKFHIYPLTNGYVVSVVSSEKGMQMDPTFVKKPEELQEYITGKFFHLLPSIGSVNPVQEQEFEIVLKTVKNG